MGIKRIATNFFAVIFTMALIFMGVRYIRHDQLGKAAERYAIEIFFPDFDINAIAQQDSILWIGGKSGLKGLNLNTFEELQLDEAFDELNFIRGLAVDPSGVLWIAHFSGIHQVNNGHLSDFSPHNLLPDKRINTVYRDRQNRIWLGTWKGAFWWDGSKWNEPASDSGLLNPMVNAIYQDRAFGLWFGSYVAPKGGVSYFHDGEWQYWTQKEGLPHTNITSIVEDSCSIWIGTGLYKHGGVFKIKKGSGSLDEDYQILNKSDGLAGEKIRSLYRDSNNRIWLGFEYDGISILKNGVIRHVDVRNGLSNNEVKCFHKNEFGLWIGTRQGLNFVKVHDIVYLMLSKPQN